jgi:two-component system, LuxR family, response regulator FixJ
MIEPTVFIVDDDASIRDALSLLLSLKGIRSLMYATAEDFLSVYQSEWRGCLLTDIRMPGMSGLDLQSELVTRGVTLSCVVLTAHGDATTARAALKNGAVDFLEKPVNKDVLVDVLTNAIRVDADRFRAHSEQQEASARLSRLTPREREVLILLGEGCSYREIGEKLAISPRTVEVYKGRMLEKLQCRTLADMVRLASEADNR